VLVRRQQPHGVRATKGGDRLKRDSRRRERRFGGADLDHGANQNCIRSVRVPMKLCRILEEVWVWASADQPHENEIILLRLVLRGWLFASTI